MNDFQGLMAIYFIYGLAFFSLGLVLIIEAGRTPVQEQKRLLLPLSMFGLLHGLHEWLEIVIIQSGPLEGSQAAWVNGVRLVLLALSFVALWGYGVQAFQVARQYLSLFTLFGLVTLPVYALLILVDVISAFVQGQIGPMQMANGLVRYLLGVPGAALAALGLRAGANRAQTAGRQPHDTHLNRAAVGFALYSLTQLFVPTMHTFLAGIAIAENIQQATGFPIQLVRTLTAIIIAFNVFRAVQFLEDERQRQLAAAQQAHLEALEQQETLRRDHLRHIVRVQEEERARVARELHDEMAQTLTAFSLQLAALGQSVPARSKAQTTLRHLQQLGKQMSQGIHRMVYDLRPALLDDLGLAAALQSLAENDGPRLGLSVSLVVEGRPHRFDPLVETVAYRVAQEAVTNAARHAQTQSASLRLCFTPDHLEMAVTDQGVGFDPGQMFAPPRGWGLAGMRERAESVGGSLILQSKPGTGTLIKLSIPLGPTTVRSSNGHHSPDAG